MLACKCATRKYLHQLDRRTLEGFCTDFSLMVLHGCIGLITILEYVNLFFFFFFAFVNLGRIPHSSHVFALSISNT